MDKRLYPIDLRVFNALVLPVIEQNYIWKGRPPVLSHLLKSICKPGKLLVQEFTKICYATPYFL